MVIRRIAGWLVVASVALMVAGPPSPAASLGAPLVPPSTASPLPGGASEDWWATVQQNIERAEYDVTWQDGRYHAPNRAHNLRTYFKVDGIDVTPRTGATAAWRWGMRLRGWGAATLSAAGNRIEYRRAGVTEWYVNDERGLEQGFTVLAAPTSAARTDRLELELEILGTLTPALSTDGQALELTTGGVQVLRYGDLAVHDAVGRSLAARMSLTARPLSRSPLVRITVEAAGAIYPITIDPLTSSPVWTAETNQASAGLHPVATAGDVNGDGYSDVIVGAYTYDNGQVDEGRAFVYHGSAAGPSLSPNWTAESNQPGANFGRSAATAGDVNGDGYSDVIVGASLYDNGQTDEGRASVFHGSSTGLSTIANWTVESNQTFGNLGTAVATAADVNGDGYSDVIVSCPSCSNGQSEEGRVFVHHGSAAGLSVAANWSTESNQAGAEAGWGIGTAGDVNGDGYSDVIISALYYDNGQTDEGRVSVHHGSAAGLSLAANWTVESNQAFSQFGLSAATAGDVNGDGYSDVIIGARHYDNGQTDEGRVFVYHGSGAGLSLSANWSAESDQAGAQFGFTVGPAGDVNGDGYGDVLVGAPNFANGHPGEGRAFVYQGSPGGLGVTATWTAESNQVGASLGSWVATAGDVNGDGFSDVIVNAPNFDNGQTDEGRALVYRGSAAGLRAAPSWTGQANQSNSYFGESVATAGDVNGDGYSDVIVGARTYDNGQADEGRVYIFHGSATGPSMAANAIRESNQAGAMFGISVGAAGDVNGDGFSDVIVGAMNFSNGQAGEGRAFVFHGSGTGISAAANWTAESNQAAAQFGQAVGTAGDVNGDGFADVIVGAPKFDNGQTDEGRIFVYHGSAAGLSAAPNATRESNQAGALYGISVATAGDVNRDGYTDVIVGAWFYDNGQVNEGAVFVYHGSAAGVSAAANAVRESNQASAGFGYSVAAAGDVNGDGYSDIIVGAFAYDNGQTDEGVAFVYHGSAAGVSAAPSAVRDSNQAGASFGISVGTAGDVNGDGFSDVIVGAIDYTNGQMEEGRAFVYDGSPAGISTAAKWSAEGNQVLANFGAAVGTAGDVNGDGYSDVIVGAPLVSLGQANEGAAFLFYGNGGRGMSLRPRQRRANNSAPIAYLGRSDSSTSFLVQLLLRNPYGRGRMRLETEVKPLGTPFTGTGLILGAWINGAVAGTNVNQLVPGLSAATNYHWRVRIRYHPARLPFQPYSRWLAIPWNGRNEKDLRTF